MADRSSLAEAYNQLGQMNTAAAGIEKELRQNLTELDARYQELTKQQAEARDHGDWAAADRIEQQVEALQEAWVAASEHLRQYGDEETPSPATTTAARKATSPASTPPSASDPPNESAAPSAIPSNSEAPNSDSPTGSGSPGEPPSTTDPEPTRPT